MDFAAWEPTYERILDDFGFDRKRDEEAAATLAALLRDREPPEASLRSLFSGVSASVVGASAQAAADVAQGLPGVIVAADKATPVVQAHGWTPQVVVTDLDGPEDALVRASRLGAVLVVHAHGDNIPALERVIPRLPGAVLGTAQCEPVGPLRNFGGFTDGDRACFLASHYGASRIELFGFDFDDPGPGTRDLETKKRKLRWARRLIEDVARTTTVIGL